MRRFSAIGLEPPFVRSSKGTKTLKNFLALFFAVCTCAGVQAATLPEVERSTIEYKSPAEALEALRSKRGVEISV